MIIVVVNAWAKYLLYCRGQRLRNDYSRGLRMRITDVAQGQEERSQLECQDLMRQLQEEHRRSTEIKQVHLFITVEKELFPLETVPIVLGNGSKYA